MIRKIFKTIKDVLSIIIPNTDGYTDYLTELERKEEAKQKPYLEEKADRLNEASQEARIARIRGSHQSIEKIMELRKREERERIKANCRFSKKKWRQLKLHRQSKILEASVHTQGILFNKTKNR